MLPFQPSAAFIVWHDAHGRFAVNASCVVPATAAPGAFEPYHVRPSRRTAIAPAKPIAIGRRDSRRSRERSMNGMPIRMTMNAVGMMIVASSSRFGFWNSRSSSNRKKKYHSGRGS